MMKLDAGLMTSLPAFDPGSAAVWGSKSINPRPQSCLCLAWSGYSSNDDDDDDHKLFRICLLCIIATHTFAYHVFSAGINTYMNYVQCT